jgi:hypothetical protein
MIHPGKGNRNRDSCGEDGGQGYEAGRVKNILLTYYLMTTLVPLLPSIFFWT